MNIFFYADSIPRASIVTNTYSLPMPSMSRRECCLLRCWIPSYITNNNTCGKLKVVGYLRYVLPGRKLGFLWCGDVKFREFLTKISFECFYWSPQKTVIIYLSPDVSIYVTTLRHAEFFIDYTNFFRFVY